MLPLALLLFGVWWRMQPAPRPVLLPGLMLLPWVAFCAVNWYFRSPTPWAGALEVVLWGQAAALLLLVAHLTGWKPATNTLLLGLGSLAFVAATAAFFQIFIRPGWLPLGRVQVPLFLDRASGPLAVPNSLAGLLLLVFPLSLSVAAMRRYAAPLRLASGTVTLLLLLAIVFTASRGALLALLLLLAASPLLFFRRRKSRLRAWGWGTVGVVLLGLLLAHNNPTLGARLVAAWEENGEATRPVMWEAAWNMFTDNPVVGQGTASYAVRWEGFRPPEGFFTPIYAHSDYLQVLGEHGVIGFFLLFAPFAWLLWAGWRRWLALPFQRTSQEASFRALRHDIHSLPQEERERQIRKHRRSRVHSPAPSGKVLLGGLLMGLCAFFLHLVVDFHLRLAGLVFVVMVAAGIVVRLSESPRRHVESPLRSTLLMGALWLSAGLLFRESWLAVNAQMLYLNGSERREIASDPARPTPLRERVRELQVARFEMRLATDIDPQHADAWAGQGRALLDAAREIAAGRLELAAEAEGLIRNAISIQPGNWKYHADLARALRMRQAPATEVEAGYRQAVELAPFTPVPHYLLAEYLSMLPGRRAEAEASIDRALELYPHYAPAKRVRERLLLRHL